MHDSLPGRTAKWSFLATFIFVIAFSSVASAATITDILTGGTLDRTAFDSSNYIVLDYNFGTGKTGSASPASFQFYAWKVTGMYGNYVTVDSVPSLTSGDFVLLVNLQGTSVDNGNVGNYEILEVSSVSGSVVYFKSNIVNSYGSPSSQQIYLQQIPQYTNLFINSDATASGWKQGSDYSTGVIALMVKDTLYLYARISADGLGYAGGDSPLPDQQGTYGYAGESITGLGSTVRNYNMGGGGGGRQVASTGDCDTGGGGGGYYSTGANGKYYSADPNAGCSNSVGLGGIVYPNLADRPYPGLYLGSGGGGGGGRNNTKNYKAGNGGRGGGAVIIFARNIAGGGTIDAKGSKGDDGTGVNTCGGGGGSGGTVLVTTLSSIQVNVAGAAGGANSSGARAFKGGAGGNGYYFINNKSALISRFSTGTYTSRVFTEGYNEYPYGSSWTNMSWTSSYTGENNVTLYYHTCDDVACSGEENIWTQCTSNPCIMNVQGKYFQYKAVLSTSNLLTTSSLNGVTINYVNFDSSKPNVWITGAPLSWVNTDQTATIGCNDVGASGCDDQSYSFKTYSTPSSPYICPAYSTAQYTLNIDPNTLLVTDSLLISSQTWVCGAASDRSGNWNYTARPSNFSIDKDIPTAEVRNEPSTWVKSINLVLNCSDSLSGCSQTAYYTFVSSPGSDCQTGGNPIASGSLAVNSDHNDYLCLRVSDNAGNIATAVSSQLFVDATPPATTDDVNVNAWYGSPATIRLTCSDSMSGCSRTYYCINDSGPTCTPSIPSSSLATDVDVSCPGQQTCNRIIRYYSQDVAGNNETPKTSGVIKIDPTLPVCTITSPASAYTTTNQITVSWQASSPGSPIANVIVENNKTGSWEQLTSSPNAIGTFTFSNAVNGVTYSFQCTATNQMGTPSGYSSIKSTMVDTVPPTVSISVSSTVVNTTTFLVSWSGDDSESGISNFTLFYKTGSGSYSQWPQVFKPSETSAVFGQNGVPVIPQNGITYTLKVRASDNAGNTKESNETSVLVDTAKPTCTVQDMPAYQPSSDFTVTWSGTDGESGIKEYIVEQRTGSSWVQFYRGSGTSNDMLNANDGVYRFRCRAIDNANNMGDLSSEKSTSVDINPPSADINFSSSVYVNDNLNINARVTDAIKVSSVTLYYNNTAVNGTVATNPNQSIWDVTWTLSDLVTTGMQTFIIRVQDIAGNSYNYTKQFLVAYCTPSDVIQGCLCGTGTKTCRNDGTWSNCTGVTKYPQPEVCNGEDDDCNNIVDDIKVNGVPGNSIQSTHCQCYGSSLLAATNEICDGIDNNCDGQIDENGNCCDEGDTQPCARTQGICTGAVKTCTGGKFGDCSILPKAKDCTSSLDNDCNGLIDSEEPGCLATCADMDGDGYGSPGTDSCANGPSEDCNDNDATIYPGAPPTCNGKDNNCDGSTDDEEAQCATCSNGIQDGNEEGIDCGGDCPACFVWGWLFLTAGGIVILLILAFVWLHFKKQGRELSWEELKKKWTPSE